VFVLLALRDLEFRRRRFFVAVLAVGLVFGIALLLSGLSGAFYNESRRVVGGLGADRWVVFEGTTGPFTSGRLLPAAAAAELEATAGVETVTPLLVSNGVVDDEVNANLLGMVFDGLHEPDLAEGRLPQSSFEVVADESLPGSALGQAFELAGRSWSVVGRTTGQRYFAGQPVIFANIDDVRDVQMDGAAVVSAFLVRGQPESMPPGLAALVPQAVVDDMDRALDSAAGTIDMLQILLWLVAAGIIGTIVYLTALERVQDFAVLKATGSSDGSLLAGLLLQAGLIALIASGIAMVVAQVLQPVFPMAVEMPASSYVGLPLTALAIAGVASFAGVRRVLTVDPALAFGG
jgi:putative ABC transport system permease protein